MKNCQHCHAPLTGQQRKNCQKCSLEAKHKRNSEWHQTNKEHRAKKDRINHRSPSNRWHCLLQNAKKRKHEVFLTREQFEIISTQPCHYCKGLLDQDLGLGSHLDRVNNTLGYSSENSVSCCNFCNRIKQHLLTSEETKIVIKTILELRNIK